MPDRTDASRPESPQQPEPPKQTAHPTDPPLPDFLVVGQVLRPHGIRGELLVEASSETFRSIRPGGELFLGSAEQPEQVVSLRAHRGRYIMQLEGYADRNGVEPLRGREIRIALEHAEPLPEGTYYRWQILDLKVLDESGLEIGSIAEIIETGANDVYVVQRAGAEDLLLPAIDSVILRVDLAAGTITVTVPEGL